MLIDNLAINNAALKLGVDKNIPGYTAPEVVMPKTMKERQEEIKKDVLAKKYFKFKTEAAIHKAGFPDDLLSDGNLDKKHLLKMLKIYL